MSEYGAIEGIQQLEGYVPLPLLRDVPILASVVKPIIASTIEHTRWSEKTLPAQEFMSGQFLEQRFEEVPYALGFRCLFRRWSSNADSARGSSHPVLQDFQPMFGDL